MPYARSYKGLARFYQRLQQGSLKGSTGFHAGVMRVLSG